jgi:hypothetical protein
MITIYFSFQAMDAELPWPVPLDEELWNLYTPSENLPSEYHTLAEAFDVLDGYIKDLVEKMPSDFFMDTLWWGFRIDQAVAFFHVTSSRNRYEHMRLYGKLDSTFEIET